jgi:hypothetical protein
VEVTLRISNVFIALLDCQIIVINIVQPEPTLRELLDRASTKLHLNRVNPGTQLLIHPIPYSPCCFVPRKPYPQLYSTENAMQ